jgi:thiamine-phosphate pyrophosphorylase
MNARSLRPRLFAFTDQQRYSDCLLQAEILCEQAQPQTVAVILRDRELPVRNRLLAAERLRRVTLQNQQYLFVSDRFDLARIVAADGVHLPTSGFSPRVCREIWGGAISRAGHMLEDLSGEDWAALDMLLVSPVAEARKGRPALGESGLMRVLQGVRQRNERVGIYALSGVTAVHAASLIRSGASGVAAVGAAWDQEQRGALLAALGIHTAAGG